MNDHDFTADVPSFRRVPGSGGPLLAACCSSSLSGNFCILPRAILAVHLSESSTDA